MIGRRSLLVLACFAATYVSPAFTVLAEEAADLFECGVCHVMSLRDFRRRGTVTLVPSEKYAQEPTGTQNIASTSGMCLSCHDGFVMDSRAIWKDGYKGHRLGMAPSSRINVPMLADKPEFPMNRDGNMYCGTCHSAHLSRAKGAATKVPLFMRVGSDNGQLCKACHEAQASIAGSSHDHGSRRRKDFERRGECAYCHAPHESGEPVMWARARGDGNIAVNTLCRSCHKDGPNPAEHPSEVVAWSQEIREAMRGNSPAAMPVYAGHGKRARTGHIGCPTCHNVHQQRAPGRPEHLPGKFLRMPQLVEPLCADCHGLESIYLYKFFHSELSR